MKGSYVKYILLILAILIFGGIIGYASYMDHKTATIEVDGVTYTVDEYNKMVAMERQQKLNEEQKKSSLEKNVKLLTLIDDDGYNSFYELLLPVLKEKNISISMAIETGNVGTGDFMSWETIAECHGAGAEVLNHSRYHIYSREESEKREKDDVKEEMLGSIQDLTDHGYEDTSDIYIYPGASAGSTWSIAKEVFRVGINSSGSEVNLPPFSQFNIHRYPMGSDHIPDFEEMKGYIDELVESGGWEIWMMHSHNGNMTEEYINALKEAIDYCDEVGVQIVSAKEALDFYGIEKR